MDVRSIAAGCLVLVLARNPGAGAAALANMRFRVGKRDVKLDMSEIKPGIGETTTQTIATGLLMSGIRPAR